MPRILVVQHHRPAAQCFELWHIFVAVDDFGVAVPPEVGVEAIQAQRLIGGVRQQIGNGGYHRGQLGRVVPAMSEHVVEHLEDAVFDLGVPLLREIRIRRLHRGHLSLAIFPRRQDGHVQVIAEARHIRPPGGLHLVHGDLETIGPEQVQRHVAHQLEFALVGAGLDLLEDVGPGWRLGIEVPPHHGIELRQTVERGKVQIGKAVGRKDDLAMLVDFEGLHCRSPFRRDVMRFTRSMRRWQ